MGILIVWGALGLIGVIIYLVRTGYLWPFIREQIWNPLRLGYSDVGSDMGSILFNMILTPILMLAMLLFRNLFLWGLAILLGPVAIFVALRVKPEEMIRTIPVDIESDWRMELKDVYTHYYAGEYLFQCHSCESLEPMKPCTVCGCTAYGPGSSTITCRKCGTTTGTSTCPQCNHRNPVKGSLVAVRPKLVAGGM